MFKNTVHWVTQFYVLEEYINKLTQNLKVKASYIYLKINYGRN